jgi:hypothetical protein
MMQTAIEADGEGSVARRIWLGSLVGLAVGVLCWRGNQSPHRLGAPAGGRAAGSGQLEDG